MAIRVCVMASELSALAGRNPYVTPETAIIDHLDIEDVFAARVRNVLDIKPRRGKREQIAEALDRLTLDPEAKIQPEILDDVIKCLPMVEGRLTEAVTLERFSLETGKAVTDHQRVIGPSLMERRSSFMGRSMG